MGIFGTGLVLGAVVFAHTPAWEKEIDPDRSARPHGWSTQWIAGGSAFRRLPNNPDFGMLAVNELGIGFRHVLVRRFSLSFAIGGAVFHHRLRPRTIRHEVGLWTDVGLRRDLLGSGGLVPYVAVHLRGRWFDPIESHQWTLMGAVGPAAGLEWRWNRRAGVLAQGEVAWEAVAAERDRGPLRGNAVSVGGRAALAVHY